MGYAKDLGTGTVHSICPITGYPRTQYGHLLDTASLHDGRPIPDWDKPGTELPNFTSPYGHLFFAIGSGDDFWCFDFADVNAGPRGSFIVLHATINSETGRFIEDAPHGYRVMPANGLSAHTVRAPAGYSRPSRWSAHPRLGQARHRTAEFHKPLRAPVLRYRFWR